MVEKEGMAEQLENKENKHTREEDDKVKFGRNTNPIQGETAVDGDGRAQDGEGDLGGLLEDEGLTSSKKGSFIPQEPAGKPDPPETSKEAQRREWRRIMEKSRKRQEEVEKEEKAKKESSKHKKRKKPTVVGGGGGERVSEVRNFWKRRESQL